MSTAGHHSPVLPPRRDPAAAAIAALRRRAEVIRRQELSRLEGRWDTSCTDDLLRLEALTRRIVEAILREPTARLAAADVESARFLFDLDAPEPERPLGGARA